MVEVTLEITRRCPHAESCDYCSTGATVDGKHLSKAKVFDGLDKIIERINANLLIDDTGEEVTISLPDLKDEITMHVEFFGREKIDVLNISGGEPLCHPDFFEILTYCETIAPEVWVYTCALKNIRYNTHVVKEMRVEANLVLIAGRENYVPKSPTKTHVLKLIHQGRGKDLPEQDIVVSRNFYDPNCAKTCDHIYLQADGKIVAAPCKKEY